MILEILMEVARAADPGPPISGKGPMIVTVAVILFVVLLVIATWSLIIWGIVWLVRYLKTAREERQRFRLESGKMAEEVRLLRRELKQNKDTDLAVQ